MAIFDISDASEFKDATMEAKVDDLIVLAFYDSASRDAIHAVEKEANVTVFDEILFFRADLSETQELAEQYHVKHAPIVLFMKGGKVVDRLDGQVDQQVLHTKLIQNNWPTMAGSRTILALLDTIFELSLHSIRGVAVRKNTL